MMKAAARSGVQGSGFRVQETPNTQHLTPNTQPDSIAAAEMILRRFGPRAISMLTAPRPADDGRMVSPKLSANDCYVALEEASRKVARVALRNYAKQHSGEEF